MKIASWNCFRGRSGDRAKALDHLGPDVVVLQECSNVPPTFATEAKWFGENQNHGVAVLATPPYQFCDLPALTEHSVFACCVTGPLEFNLLAVWAHPKPSYVGAIWAGLDAYAPLILGSGRPTVLMGDFNSHPRFDRPGQRTHGDLRQRLGDEFGLVSAWHAFRPDGGEPSTLYFRWKEAEGFHIDYCFVPEAWVPHIADVQIPEFGGRDWRSDHRPLMVSVDLPSSAIPTS